MSIFIKSWQFDQTNIDEALDADRFNERAFGGDLAEQKNDDLFVIDRGGKKKTPTKRKASAGLTSSLYL